MSCLVRRREFLSALGATAAAWVLPAAGAPATRRRNVLFIAVDDLRPQLGCYGHKQMVSPHLDRLAAAGVPFSRAYCQQAVCAPSRASLLTGMRPDSTGIYDLFTPVRKKLPGVVTLPQHFRGNGYQSLSLGKIYHHRNDDAPGWSEKPWHPQGPSYLWPDNQALDEYAARVSRGRTFRSRGPATEAADVADAEYPDGKIADRAVELLRANRDRPFFLAVGFYKPHLPFIAPKRYWDFYVATLTAAAERETETVAYFQAPPPDNRVFASQKLKLSPKPSTHTLSLPRCGRDGPLKLTVHFSRLGEGVFWVDNVSLVEAPPP